MVNISAYDGQLRILQRYSVHVISILYQIILCCQVVVVERMALVSVARQLHVVQRLLNHYSIGRIRKNKTRQNMGLVCPHGGQCSHGLHGIVATILVQCHSGYDLCWGSNKK